MAECGCEWYKEHNERKQGDFMTKKLFLILIKLNDSDSLAINYTSPKNWIARSIPNNKTKPSFKCPLVVLQQGEAQISPWRQG